MAYVKNYCTECQDEWTFSTLHATLNETDRDNLKRYGTLVSVCEECSEGHECESVELC